MARYIDADALIKDMRSRKYIDKALCEIFETIVDNAPTAYDVEAVIKELRKDEICSRCLNSHNPVSVCAEFCDLGKKLEFIRNGKKE